jgi:DNA-binding transcriptional regulator YiaG
MRKGNVKQLPAVYQNDGRQEENGLTARPHLNPLPRGEDFHALRLFEKSATALAGRLFAQQEHTADYSFSWGRIALLDYAQRHIRVSRAHIPTIRHHRKPIPTAITTPGDYLRAKRYEQGLHPYQIGAKMGIAASLITAWEKGEEEPNEEQWKALSNLLAFDSGIQFQKPHR